MLCWDTDGGTAISGSTNKSSAKLRHSQPPRLQLAAVHNADGHGGRRVRHMMDVFGEGRRAGAWT